MSFAAEGFLIGYSFADDWEWRLPAVFIHSVGDPGSAEHAFIFGLSGVALGNDRTGFFFALYPSAGITWRWRLREGLALTTAVSLTSGVSNRFFNLVPASNAAFVFDLGPHFSLEPWVGVSAQYGRYFSQHGDVVVPGASIGLRPMFHPTRFLDVGLNSFVSFNPVQADVSLLAHATIRL